MYDRWYSPILKKKLSRPYVHILFGARQTGKSTLLKSLLPEDMLFVDLADPEVRSRHLADSGLFAGMCRSLPEDKQGQVVFVDEVQLVVSIFDAVQSLYDQDKLRWRFVLCGSSARKLRKLGANLLPGRSFLHHLYPLTMIELPSIDRPMAYAQSPLPFPWSEDEVSQNVFPNWDLMTRLAFGALPGIVTAASEDRVDLLRSYTSIHLEEEIRREALVKDWGSFVRFLGLAASESGQSVNYAAISQEAGITAPTVKSYYQLLEDMFVGFQVLAYSKSPRKNLLSTSKFLFFDLGVRHAAAGLVPSIELVKSQPGVIFEQWVGIELWKRLQYVGQGRLCYQRTKSGFEVDYILDLPDRVVPIEVKWTDKPTLKDARHIVTFCREHGCDHGYVVCRCPHPVRLNDQVTALPWFCL